MFFSIPFNISFWWYCQVYDHLLGYIERFHNTNKKSKWLRDYLWLEIYFLGRISTACCFEVRGNAAVGIWISFIKAEGTLHLCQKSNGVCRARAFLCREKNVCSGIVFHPFALRTNNTHRVYFHENRNWNMNLSCNSGKKKCCQSSLIFILQSLVEVLMIIPLNKSFVCIVCK